MRAEGVFSMDLKKTGITQMLCKDTLSAECIENFDTAIRIWTDGYCKGKADKETKRLMVDRGFAKNAPEIYSASVSFIVDLRASWTTIGQAPWWGDSGLMGSLHPSWSFVNINGGSDIAAYICTYMHLLRVSFKKFLIAGGKELCSSKIDPTGPCGDESTIGYNTTPRLDFGMQHYAKHFHQKQWRCNHGGDLSQPAIAT